MLLVITLVENKWDLHQIGQMSLSFSRAVEMSRPQNRRFFFAERIKYVEKVLNLSS